MGSGQAGSGEVVIPTPRWLLEKKPESGSQTREGAWPEKGL